MSPEPPEPPEEPGPPVPPESSGPPPADTPHVPLTFPPDAADLLAGLGLDTALGDTSFTLGPVGPPPAVPGYDLLGELGSGGMGVVYKAREHALSRTVALKMIRPGARPAAADVLRFRLEAAAIAAVRHPNVVEVYSSGWAGGRPYFVMEYVAGGSLAALLERGPLRPAAAAGLLAAVARGVHAAHAAGIVHRDLKPGNVLLDVGGGRWAVGSGESPGAAAPGLRPGFQLPTAHRPPPTPKVSDFGLAKRLDVPDGGATRTVAVLGTPAYMAPEQARARAKFVGPEADVYALGAILYECLTGRPPFQDDDPLALMRKVADEVPPPPRAVARHVPRDLDLICRKCLAKEAGDRYPTAADLADDLDRFRAGLPVHARPIPRAVRAWRWARRHPAPAALAGLLAVLLTAGPAAVVWEIDRAADGRTREAAHAQAATDARRRADARELFALGATVRRRAADRPAGWTWANAADLRRAVALAAGDPAALADLRDDAATAALAADLRPAGPVAVGFTPGVAATGPDGRIALGEAASWGFPGAFTSLRVLLLDPAAGKVDQELKFPAAPWVLDRVVSLAFAPDGRWVFAGTRGKKLVRLDPAGGPAKVWDAPATPDALAVTAGGEVLGVCGKALVRWDAATGAVRGVVGHPAGVCNAAAAVPGGGAVVGVGHTLFRVPAGPDPLPPLPAAAGDWVKLPAFLPCGRLLAVARGCGVELFDAATLRPAARFADPHAPDGACHADDVTSLAVHPSGAYLATASADRVVKVWAVAAGRPVAAAPVGGTDTPSVAWSGCGRFLVVTGPGRSERFEFAAPAAERFAGFHPEPLLAAAPAGGGRVAALGEFGPAAPPTRLLFRTDPAGRLTDETGLPRRGGGTRPGVAVHPASGAVAVTPSGDGLGWWTPAGKGPPPPDPGAECRCPAFAPDGTAWAVVGASGVRAWDAATGRPRGPGWANAAGLVVLGQPSLEALAVGRTVAAAGGADGAVHLLDADAAHLAMLPGGRDPVRAVAVAPADDVVAAGTHAGALRLVRVADRAELPGVPDAHPGGVTAAAFSPDGGLLVTGGKDRAVRFWRRADDRVVPAAAVTGLPAPVRSAAFDADGRLVLLLAGERAVRVWDAARLRADLAAAGLGW